MPALFPVPGQEIWQLGNQLAALGGVRGQDFHFQRALRGIGHHYKVSDNLAELWWSAHGETAAQAVAAAQAEGRIPPMPDRPVLDDEPATPAASATAVPPANPAPDETEESTQDPEEQAPAETDTKSTQRPPARKSNARKG